MSWGGSPQGRGWGIRILPLLIGLLFIGFMYLKNRQEGPFGRTQVVALSPDQETQLGLQAYREVTQKTEVIRDGPVPQAVHEIARRLTEAVGNPAFQQRLGGDKEYLERFNKAVQAFRWDVSV